MGPASAGNEHWAKSFGGTLSNKAACFVPFGDGDLYMVGNFESDIFEIDNSILFNQSDTGSHHVHMMHDWHWRHPNIFIAQFTDEYNSTSKIEATSSTDIFPNPSNGQYSLKGLDIEEVSVFTIQGQLVQRKVYPRQSNTSEQISLDIRNQANGIYIVKVIAKNGKSIRKIIKQSGQ